MHDEPFGTIDSHGPMLATASIGDVEDAAAFLAVDEPEVQLQHWLNLSAALLERVKVLRERVEQTAIAWIDANGPVQVGDIRYSIGVSKTVKCTDAARCLQLVLDACRGDLDALTTHLRADPFKYGSVRTLLGESLYDQVFCTETKPKLVEGKPQPTLIKTNTRFALQPSRDVPAGDGEPPTEKD
ncbi:MAG TPA: hypothetical protein VF624_11010 [Tepidisphaeraceae bacterium]